MVERIRFSLVEQHDRDEIVAATLRYLKANSKVSDVAVVCERLEGGFARASGKDGSGKAGKVYAYLKRNKDSKWDVLAVGTFFEPDFFKRNGIPETLRMLAP